MLPATLSEQVSSRVVTDGFKPRLVGQRATRTRPQFVQDLLLCAAWAFKRNGAIVSSLARPPGLSPSSEAAAFINFRHLKAASLNRVLTWQILIFRALLWLKNFEGVRTRGIAHVVRPNRKRRRPRSWRPAM